MNEKYIRQLGIVDQENLNEAKILVSGNPNGVGELIVILAQLGAGNDSKGLVGISVPELLPNSLVWKLAFGEHSSWDDWKSKNTQMNIKLVKGIQDHSEWDIHLTLDSNCECGDINGITNGMRGFVSKEKKVPKFVNLDNQITPCIRTAVASIVVHQAIIELGLRREIVVSEAWLTVTCRVESTDLERVRELVRGKSGELLDVKTSEDGMATIAKYRYPGNSSSEAFSHLDIVNNEVQEKRNIEIDAGIIPWFDEQHESERTIFEVKGNVTVLGIGGLGSWASPLLLEALSSGCINLVDGDLTIENHNLNRQLLYKEKDVGGKKSEVAEQRLSKYNPSIKINGFPTYLNNSHIYETNTDDDDLGEGILNERLSNAIKSSDVNLACLDNMAARTLLNEASVINEVAMINGGGESIHGIIERFSDDGCMICRYGNDTARSVEKISCTEEGTRPIASIVTTTAWTGSMMAALAILELCNLDLYRGMRCSFEDGNLEINKAGKPIWYDENCARHLLHNLEV
jgi:molybdopterin/thiamine biosynthesis adenylyltransferase